jgi:uncharacterized repeat protein (TIGR03803 family)
VTLAVALILGLAMTQPAQAQTFTVIHTFHNDSGGAFPEGGVIVDSAGTVYGATTQGGAYGCNDHGCGTVWKLTGNGTFTVLHAFEETDGVSPESTLLKDKSGNLYGTAALGGSYGYGTVYEISSSGVFTTLFNFDGSDGLEASSGLVEDDSGNLYGTTEVGGDLRGCNDPSGCGTVYQLNITNQTETVLHAFVGGQDGQYPGWGNILRDSEGNLYGTTYNTVWEVQSDGTKKTLFNFPHGKWGHSLEAQSLVFDAKGNLYGTTSAGGLWYPTCQASQKGCGLVFKLDKAGTETVLHRFGQFPDGAWPLAGLLLDDAGNLYGTTSIGGDSKCRSGLGCGTIFKLDPRGKLTVLHKFTGSEDGALPVSGTLFRDSNGALYGTTAAGGDPNCYYGYNLPGCGVVFKITLK